MESLTKLCWALLAALHLGPALVLVSPGMVQKLYGAAPDGTVGTLLVHRGALFAAVVAICVYAAFSHEARKAAFIVTAISMAGFLFVYARAGFPGGPLTKIAAADLMGLVPLALAGVMAWR